MGYSLKSNMTGFFFFLNKDKLFFSTRKKKGVISLVCYTEGYGMSGNSVCLMPMSSSDGKRK